MNGMLKLRKRRACVFAFFYPSSTTFCYYIVAQHVFATIYTKKKITKKKK